jgi:hypothetical protein
MDVEEVQPRGCAPVTEQSPLDMLAAQRLSQKRIVEEIDLADRQIVRRPPPGVKETKLVV